MILINLKKNKNEKMPNAFGKYYAFPVINQTIGMDGLSEHMASHNTPFSAGAIKGMLTDLVSCIRELTLQGIAVKSTTWPSSPSASRTNVVLHQRRISLWLRTLRV